MTGRFSNKRGNSHCALPEGIMGLMKTLCPMDMEEVLYLMVI